MENKQIEEKSFSVKELKRMLNGEEIWTVKSDGEKLYFGLVEEES